MGCRKMLRNRLQKNGWSTVPLAVLALGLTAGCKFDAKETKWQLMPDMADTPSTKAQEDYLDPPTGSIALNAILYPATAAESSKLLKNPLARHGGPLKKIHSERGKVLYERYCTPCHGSSGKGDGLVPNKWPAIKPPSLLDPEVYDKPDKGDGYVFHYITHGGANMPGYGHAISANERWEIVLHLRSLQKGE